MGLIYTKSAGKGKYISPGVYVVERDINIKYNNPVVNGYIKINGKIHKALDVIDFYLTEEEVNIFIKNESRKEKLNRILEESKN